MKTRRRANPSAPDSPAALAQACHPSHCDRVKSVRPYLIWFAVAVLLALAAVYTMQWLRKHPEHNPAARFELAQPQGWATQRKLMGLAGDADACFAAFDRAGAGYLRRPPIGQGGCRADQRMILTGNKLVPTMAPAEVAPSCAVTAAMVLWHRDVVAPLTRKYFGQRVARIENLGSYNCRNIRGGTRLSQHSTANAIDVSAFVLADGTRVSVVGDWSGGGAKAAFLREVRDGACDLFSTTLSPDFNAAHADHFHLDLTARKSGWTTCR
ncbi:MAG: extensin family protein [Sphingopyxis sp.]|nr:extensin family protein [Sphingopyxis sp.]